MSYDDKKLYSIKELILWLENYPGWQGGRPLKYAKYARLELESAKRNVFAAFCAGIIFGMFIMLLLAVIYG